MSSIPSSPLHKCCSPPPSPLPWFAIPTATYPTTSLFLPHCNVWCPWPPWLFQGEATITRASMEQILAQCTHSLTATRTISPAPLCCPPSRETNPPCPEGVAQTSEGFATAGWSRCLACCHTDIAIRLFMSSLCVSNQWWKQSCAVCGCILVSHVVCTG